MQKSREAVQLIAGVVIKKNWLEEACYNFKVGQEREPQLPSENSLEPNYWSVACMSKGGLHAFGLDLGVVQEQWTFVYWAGNKTMKCTVVMGSRWTVLQGLEFLPASWTARDSTLRAKEREGFFKFPDKALGWRSFLLICYSLWLLFIGTQMKHLRFGGWKSPERSGFSQGMQFISMHNWKLAVTSAVSVRR